MEPNELNDAMRAARGLATAIRELYRTANRATDQIVVERWLRVAAELANEIERVANDPTATA